MARGRKLSEVLTEEEEEVLLAQPNPRYPTGERNYTMLQVMLDTGLRVAETINLKWRHVDLQTGRLMVREGKGAKGWTLWLDEDDLELLREWRERQAEDAEGESEHVFTTLEGNPLMARYIQQLVDRLA